MKSIKTLAAAVLSNLVFAGSALAAAPAQPNIQSPTGDTNFGVLIATVINALLLFAGAVAVLFLIIGGFRYVISAGNPDQVEGAKKTILYAVLGLVIIFISYLLVQVVLQGLNVTPKYSL